MTLDGILLVDKPEGMTSATVVREVKRRLRPTKIGHLGTLDPFATGLLPLCLGEGAKIVPFLNEEGKGYEGTMRLGIATDTLDPTGIEVARAPVPDLDETTLARTAVSFCGVSTQVPPMFSALKRDGVRLYDLARQGIEVEREARRISIERFEVRRLGEDHIGFAVDGSKGMYVRTLAADFARALGTVGHLERLRRTRFGTFSVAEAVALEALQPENAASFLLAPRAALGRLRELAVAPDLERKVRMGQQWALGGLPLPETATEVAKLISADEGLIGIVAAAGHGWRIVRLLQRAQPASTLPSI